MLGVESPSNLREIARTLRDFGSFGSATRIAAMRHGPFDAIADDRGTLTFADLHQQVNQLTNAFGASGFGAGAKIGVLCRNHRVPLMAAFAGVRAGATVIYLNTAFSARQAKEVAEREGVQLLIHDPEFTELVKEIELERTVVCAIAADDPSEFDHLIKTGSPVAPRAPDKNGRIVLLTSGTTGTPKGAPREDPRGLIGPGSVLERLPMRSRQATIVSPPLFHGTGLLVALLSIALGSKLVLRPRFDPAVLLDDIEKHDVSTICVVPIMLQRVLALGDAEIKKRDLSSLRVLFSAGSQLPAEVARQATDVFGEVVYNLYGSTEVAIATLATPDDVRDAPTSVGRPLFGSRVKILDEKGEPLPQGATGRIFVGSITPFEGYTGGGGKEIIDGLLSTGDVGHFDEKNRLYIDGRDDEMIVSGGENVFPREIEELLVTHPKILDACAIGVDDPDFGQRLRAFVVVKDGDELKMAEVKSFVKENLAAYKSPRDVVFLDELPRNPTGKVLKRELE
jgi:fatty-acyl-CoA synthase